MKIIAISDIHSRLDYQPSVTSRLGKADLVLVAGDITNFGDHKEASVIVERLLQYNNNILAVPGNCDHVGVNDTLISHGIDIHGRERCFKGITLFGLGGCNNTPFHTPNEYSEPDMTMLLSRFSRNPQAGKFIFLSHAPPYKTKLDRVFFGFHAGSKAIRKFIEQTHPDLVVCGHIHEARGFDYIGDTLILNPGAFPKHLAEIDFNERISFQLH